MRKFLSYRIALKEILKCIFQVEGKLSEMEAWGCRKKQ
jgi:hypothetical protein